jgi:hypothetical protein
MISYPYYDIDVKIFLPECSAHGFVVHIRLVLMQTPESGDSFGIDQLEHSLFAVGPLDEPWTRFLILKKLEQELPKVGCGTFTGLSLEGNTIWANFLLPGFLLQFE